MASIDFKPYIQVHQAEWIARRRDLHQHPELAFEEVRTAGMVASRLTELGLEVQSGIGKTGVVALLEGETDGPTVMVRCDMDALPVREENSTDYVSQTPGKMHACGHDAHTAIGLAVAELFSERRSEIAGRIKFVFQPAEEVALGANAMIADGVLQNPSPDVVLGLHVWNEVPVGSIALIDGPMMAGASDFTIRIYGRGGHGGLPHETRDPIVAGSQIVLALQSIISRNLRPMDTAVVSVTMFRAGDAFNVIPPIAELRGTVRAFRIEVRDIVEQRMREIVERVAEAMGCTSEIVVKHLTLPVINSAEVNERLRAVFAQVAPDIQIIRDYQTMAAEDMAFFLSVVPGTFFFVGSANPERGLDYPHHHPRFDFDEAVIPLAVDLLASAVASYVIPG